LEAKDLLVVGYLFCTGESWHASRIAGGMSRKNLIRSNVHPYHVNARVNNRENFFCDLDIVWKIFDKNLNDIRERFGVKVHAFVLMPNHFHLILTTPGDDLGIVMQQFMRSVTRSITFRSERSGRVFSARYHWSLIDNIQYYDTALKYVYRNPVKSKLTIRAEEYCFSTLQTILGNKNISFPLEPIIGDPFLVPEQNLIEFLSWLNIPARTEHDLAIRKALKRSRFVM
jgi:putative transposase